MHSLLHSLSVSVHIRVQCPEQTFCLCCSVFSLHTGQCTQSLTIFHSFFTLSQPSLCTHTCNLCRSSFRNGSLTIVFSFHGYLFIYLLMKRWPNLYVKSHWPSFPWVCLRFACSTFTKAYKWKKISFLDDGSLMTKKGCSPIQCVIRKLHLLQAT